MSQSDFFVTAPATAVPAAVPAAAPATRDTSLRWWLALVAAALVASGAYAVVQWRAEAKPTAPDLSTAREFGRQAGLQLPAPVTAADCAGAVRALPGIARDPGRRAAFIDACAHASGTSRATGGPSS